MRFFFATLVIVAHAAELKTGDRSQELLTNVFGTISAGELAVDSFFVLSGYLIFKSWSNKPILVTFLTSRILRIYPGFIISCIFCVFVIGPIYSTAGYLKSINWAEFLLSLLKLRLAGTPATFQGTPYAVLNGSLWSIPYEFKCYLLVLATGIMGIYSRRFVWPAVFLGCTTVHVLNRLSISDIPFDLYFRCGMAFTAGGCFYIYKDAIKWTKVYACICLIFLLLILPVAPLAEPAVVTLWGYLIIYYAHNGKRLLGFNRLPDLSYGIYLYAWPINKIILWHFPTINLYLSMLIVFLLTVPFAAASWYVIEKPSIEIKKIIQNNNVFFNRKTKKKNISVSE
ncbi:acyltransferase [Pseudacidovorax sp. RU35E]|uniref:acyltransferase family protein n=1 Tax=Pseudacidovorax sp. RU35E TaxID=1907403 RepID=UPI0009709D4C|nr:acyltransferase [Pseudacidovorax sp. RU35E]